METEAALIRYRRAMQIKQAELAAKLGVQPPALSKWERGRVPAERVLDIERITGIPRHELRPDIYPEPEERVTEHATQ